MIEIPTWWPGGIYIYNSYNRAYVSFIRAYGRLKDLNVKAMNLHELSKSFGMERAISTDTKKEKYQKELHRVNREKFRTQGGVELNSDIWESVRKKRRVVHEKELNKMEFVWFCFVTPYIIYSIIYKLN